MKASFDLFLGTVPKLIFKRFWCSQCVSHQVPKMFSWCSFFTFQWAFKVFQEFLNMFSKATIGNDIGNIWSIMISMFPPMLGGYPKNLDISTRYHSWYHFWNPLNIKNFDIWNDILIFLDIKIMISNHLISRQFFLKIWYPR